MKRDDDYIRQQLFDVEASEEWVVLVPQVMAMSEEDNKRQYHVLLLCDAGLMTQVNTHTFRLTAQGHDFLNAVRNDTVWNKTKEGAAAIGGVSLGMLKELAMGYLKQVAAEKLGINLQ